MYDKCSSGICLMYEPIRTSSGVFVHRVERSSHTVKSVTACPTSNVVAIQDVSYCNCRDNFVNAPSQWETALQCNIVSYWLGAFIKLSLQLYHRFCVELCTKCMMTPLPVACLASCHYLNQWLSIVNWTLRNKSMKKKNQNTSIFIQDNICENITKKWHQFF